MISREKSSCKEIPGKKNFLHWKNIYFMAYNPGKKSYIALCREKIYHQGFEEKNILNQTKSSLRLLKSQMVGPLGINL